MGTDVNASHRSRWEPTPRWERRYREAARRGSVRFRQEKAMPAPARATSPSASACGRPASTIISRRRRPRSPRSASSASRILSRTFRPSSPADRRGSDKLRAAIANHLAPLRRHPDADYICVFLRHRHELPNGPRQAIAALAHAYQDLIEQLFAGGIKTREFRADLDPKLATLAMLGLCNSVITNRGVPRSSTIDAMIEEYARILIGGVVAGRRASKVRRRS